VAGPSASGDTPVVEKTGVTVTGKFGATPTVKFPAKVAPTDLTEQVLVPGKGAAVVTGDTVVANYVGETWPAKAGTAGKVFDSSFSRGEPEGFAIGSGQVIPGWDKTLVGQKLGTRILLTVPPADGYGTTGNTQAGITGTDTLVFVVDLVGDYKNTASAPGTAVVNPLPPTGWPVITNVAGKEPKITGVAGVTAPTAPTSKLLVKGSGAKIDATKTLVLQLVQTDIATNTQTQSTWGQQPQLIAASSVTPVASVLTGQNIGARAVVLLPATAAVPATATAAAQPAVAAEVLVIDVVGQF
jgi:peptidylprolyl isomerase